MKTAFSIAVFVLSILTLSSCEKIRMDYLTGVWEYKEIYNDNSGQNASIETLRFNCDNTYNSTIISWNDNYRDTSIYNGIYRLEKDILMMDNARYKIQKLSGHSAKWILTNCPYYADCKIDYSYTKTGDVTCR